MSITPPIYVISLLDSPRRSRIEKTFATMELPFHFWNGVNGASLDEASLAKVDEAYTHKEWGHGLNKGEIGCALSHIQLYEHIVSEGIESAIILEDDAHPVEGFLETLLEMLNKLPARAEMAFLHHGKAKSWPVKRTLPHGHKLVRYRYPSSNSKRCIISARGYWISRSAAIQLLKMAYPVRMPADYLTGYIQRHKLNTYGVEPNLLAETNLPSEIDAVQKRNYGTHSQ